MGTIALMGAGTGTPGGVVPIVWNSADKDPAVTLSANDTTMTSTTANTGARSNGHATAAQLVYCEFLIGVRSFDPNIGFASSDEVLTQRPGVSSPSKSFGIRLVNGFFHEGGNPADGTAISSGSASSGDIYRIAYNTNTQKIWVSVNGSTSWNAGIGGAQDPETDTGGRSLVGSTVVSSAYGYPIGTCSDASDQLTTRFNSSSWSYTAPSSFTVLGP